MAAEWPSVINVYEEGRRVMGQANPNLGTLLPGSPEDRRFCALFGVSAQVVVDAWRLMQFHGLLPEAPQLCHLLCALAFMCVYPKNDKALSELLGKKDPKTINRHMWPFIRAVFELDDYVILFENRKKEDNLNDCLLSVDGTDFRLAMKYSKPYYSYKFKKSGYRYEVGLCIKTGDICWWSGPYPPGDWNDNMIFNDALAKHLEEGERCEADKGYRGSAPRFVKCPGGLEDPDPEVKAMSARVRNRQETVNERFKNWAILTTPYRLFRPDHQTIFGAIVVLTQLSFKYNPLFPVEYNDKV